MGLQRDVFKTFPLVQPNSCVFFASLRSLDRGLLQQADQVAVSNP